MMRYLMVWIPNWAVNSLVVDIPPGAHGATEKSGFIQVVTPSARKCGVRQGMKLSMARYLCPDLLILPTDTHREFSSFELIVQACEQWVARVSCIYPGLAWAPAKGGARWSGSEEKLAENIVDSVSQWTGSESNVGIASGPLAAYAAARRGIIVPAEKTQDFLDQLDINQCLSLIPPKHKEVFSQVVHTCYSVGIKRGIDIRNIGSSALYSRFGDSGKILWELFTGKDLWVPSYGNFSPDLQIEDECEEPIDREEQAAFCARRLAHQLCQKLDQHGLRCSSIIVTAQDASRASYERQWWGIEGDEEEIADRIRWQLVAWLSQSVTEDALIRVSVQPEHCVRVGASQALWRSGDSFQRDSVLRKICAYKGENSIRIPRIIPGYSPSQRLQYVSIDESGQPHGQGFCPEGGIEESPARLYTQPYSAFLLGKCSSSLRKKVVTISDRSTLMCAPEELSVRVLQEDVRYEIVSWRGPWSVPYRWWSVSADDLWNDPQVYYLRVGCRNSPDLLLRWAKGEWSLAGVYESEYSREGDLS